MQELANYLLDIPFERTSIELSPPTQFRVEWADSQGRVTASWLPAHLKLSNEIVLGRTGIMRIVTWNCRMGLTKKISFLQDLRADIAVIPECSQSSILYCQDQGYSACWWGDHKHKGLGVVAAKPWSLGPIGEAKQRWIASVEVTGPRHFLLVAVWACRVGGIKEMNYVGQIYEAITQQTEWFDPNQPTVVCGDFNSNAIWDRERKVRNHTAVATLLSKRGLFSAYHAFFSEAEGEEKRFTHFLRYEKKSGFHIDYVFLPEVWRSKLQSVELGTYEDWRCRSDHIPVIADLVQD